MGVRAFSRDHFGLQVTGRRDPIELMHSRRIIRKWEDTRLSRVLTRCEHAAISEEDTRRRCQFSSRWSVSHSRAYTNGDTLDWSRRMFFARVRYLSLSLSILFSRSFFLFHSLSLPPLLRRRTSSGREGSLPVSAMCLTAPRSVVTFAQSRDPLSLSTSFFLFLALPLSLSLSLAFFLSLS